MKTTGNLGLKKPEGTDIVDINDLNGNMDVLDTAVKAAQDHAADTTRHITAAERTAWNAKASTSAATTAAAGLMSAGDKSKLDGVAAGANAYVHPNHTGDVTSTGDGVTAISLGVIVDADVNSAAAIAWSKLSKTGASLADLPTRSAADLNSGTLPAARLPAISGDISMAAGTGTATITAGAIVNADINAAAGIDASKIGTGVVSNTEFGYLDGVTSSIQAQLDAKEYGDSEALFPLLPSVVTIPLAGDYRAWQGVAVEGDLIYVTTDRNESFGLENIISVYTLDGRLQQEIRNAYTGTDPQGKFMSLGGASIFGGYLYITAYNFNSGGSPLISRVLKYSIPALTLIATYNIGSNVAESVSFYSNAFWVTYHDVPVVRKFDSSFVQQQEFALTVNTAPYGYFQGSFWDGNYFYANLHGHNSNGDSIEFAEMRKFTFNGSSFVFSEAIAPPTKGCTQGVAVYNKRYIWNDRPNNAIVISTYLTAGSVYPVAVPYQNEQTYKPTLINSWEIFDTSYDRAPRVTVSRGIVYLSGMTKNTTNADAYNGLNALFKLPSRYTPKYSVNLMALTDKGPVRIPIVGRNQATGSDQVGNVNAQNIMGYTGISWLSLDGLSYPILD